LYAGVLISFYLALMTTKQLEYIQSIMGGHRLEDFWYDRNADFDAICRQKEQHEPVWQQLVARIRLLDVFYLPHFREAAGGAPVHCHRLYIGYDAATQGIILNISYLTRQIGFYYCHYKVPITYPVIGTNGYPIAGIAYFPFDGVQDGIARACFELTQVYFPGFSLFNNFYATQPVENVIINETKHPLADLFQVIFGDCIMGIH
jgi:hypothetical protein